MTKYNVVMPHLPRFYQYCSPEEENKTSVNKLWFHMALICYNSIKRNIWICTGLCLIFYLLIMT